MANGDDDFASMKRRGYLTAAAGAVVGGYALWAGGREATDRIQGPPDTYTPLIDLLNGVRNFNADDICNWLGCNDGQGGGGQKDGNNTTTTTTTTPTKTPTTTTTETTTAPTETTTTTTTPTEKDGDGERVVPPGADDTPTTTETTTTTETPAETPTETPTTTPTETPTKTPAPQPAVPPELKEYIDNVVDTVEDRLEEYVNYREDLFVENNDIPDSETEDPYVQPGDLYDDEKYLIFQKQQKTDGPVTVKAKGETYISLVEKGCPVILPNDKEKKLAVAIQQGNRYKEAALESLVDAYKDLSMTADMVVEHELNTEQQDKFDDRSLQDLYRETIDRRDDYNQGSKPYKALTNLADRLKTTIDQFEFTEAHYDDVSALFEYTIKNALYDDGERVTDP